MQIKHQETKPSKYGWAKIKTANAAAIIILLSLDAMMFALLFVEIPDKNRDIFNYVSVSFLTLAVAGAIYFLFNYKKENQNESTVSDSMIWPDECRHCGKSLSLEFKEEKID